MKKLLAMVLALVMTLSLAVSANAAFKDADKVSDTYEEAVAVLNGMGVFKGYEDGSFQPRATSPARKSPRSFIACTRRTSRCAQIGRCAKQFKVLPHTAVREIFCLTD